MADWFIARNGQQEGPLSEQAVRMFINAGQLKSEDVVWQQGMNEWTPAGRVPELAALFANHSATAAAVTAVPQPSQPAAISYAMQGGGTRTTVLTERALDMLRKTRPWARLFGVLILIGAVLMAVFGVLAFFGGILGAANRSSNTGADLIGASFVGIFNIGFAVVYLMPGIYLNRYANRIGDLLNGGREDQLEAALEAQKSFWKFVGIATLLTIVLWFVIMFIMVVAMIIGFNAVHTSPQVSPSVPQLPAVPHVPTR